MISFGPFEGDGLSSETAWRAPDGARLVYDMRSPSLQDSAGIGVFEHAVPLGSEHTLLAEDFGDAPPERLRSIFASAIGVRISGTTCTEWIVSALTVHADPALATGPCSLLVGRRGRMQLAHRGRVLWRQRFDAASAVFATAIERQRNDYRRLRAAAKRGELNGDVEHHRRVLTVLGAKYRISEPEALFIPDDLPRESPLPHRTTVSDNFDGRTENLEDSADWSLYSISGTPGSFAVLSGICREDSTSPANSYAEHQTALSTDDHYSEIEVVSLVAPSTTRGYVSALVRAAANSGAVNGYDYQATRDSAGVVRGRMMRITGTSPSFTALVDEVETIGGGDVARLDVDASDLTGKINGAQTATASDGTFSSVLRVGIGSRINQNSVGDMELDNFAGGDLGAAPSAFPALYYHAQA